MQTTALLFRSSITETAGPRSRPLGVQEAQWISGLPVLRQGQNFLLRPVTVVSFCRGTASVMQAVTHADDADVHAKLGASLGFCHPLGPEAPALWRMRKPSAGVREPLYQESIEKVTMEGLCCRKCAQEEAAQVFITDTLLTTLMCTPHLY